MGSLRHTLGSPESTGSSSPHMGSLRHPLGSSLEMPQDFGPETVLGEAPPPEAPLGPTHGSRGGVSHKIQQLLNTLKRPRKNRRPVEDYYHDDEEPGMYIMYNSMCV